MNKDKVLIKAIEDSDEELMLAGTGEVIIYTDASVRAVSDYEYRSAEGLVVMFRKKKKF